MAYVGNSGRLAVMDNAVKASFRDGLEAGNLQLNWSKIATRVDSTTATENYSWLDDVPMFREMNGERVVKHWNENSYTLANKKFELTLDIPRDRVDDDQWGVYANRARSIGYEAAQHQERLVMNALLAGFDTVCYDGQFFFDTDHPVGTGTYGNDGGGSGDPWFLIDGNRAMKPFILQVRQEAEIFSNLNPSSDYAIEYDAYLYAARSRMAAGYGFWQFAYGSKDTLNTTNYVTARKQLMGVKSNNNKPIGVMPSLLICGPSNEQAALELLKAQYGAAGATNVYAGSVELVVTPFLP